MEITIESQFTDFEEITIKTLKTEKISVFYDDSCAKVARVWESVAREKAQIATDPTERTQFISCANISSSIATSLQFPSDYRSYYTCKDEQGLDQAMMILEVKSNHVYVAYLVTNPINIRSSVNENEPDKVKGAGTCLLQKAEEIAIHEGKESIKLYALSSAITFYEKNGFHSDGWGGMTKTIQKIEEEIYPVYFIA